MLKIEPKPALFQRALDEYDRAFSGDGAPRPFADLRARARASFEALGLPTRKLEAWKYTDLRAALASDYAFVHGDGTSRLEASDLDAFRLPALDAATVVLVNGAFVPTLSDLSGLPERVLVGGLREASTVHAATVEAYFARYTDVEQNAFAALNSAFDLDGLFLHVPRGVALERPVHVIHVTDAEASAPDRGAPEHGTFVQSRHLVVAGEAAQLRLVETHHVLNGAATFANVLTEVVVGPSAVVDHVRIQNEGPSSHQITTLHGYQEQQSTLSTLTFTLAGGTVRNNVALVPDGAGCQTTLGGVYILHGGQHLDTSTLVDHAAPGCTSNELYKGILYDESTGVFNGKVFVRREGQQTNAYQQSQGVVLSPHARHFSKPELEIYADDVKCSHGSTTGSIDPEGMFYLRARGVAEADARALLLYAFAHDVVEMIALEPLRDHVDALIAERLK